MYITNFRDRVTLEIVLELTKMEFKGLIINRRLGKIHELKEYFDFVYEIGELAEKQVRKEQK